MQNILPNNAIKTAQDMKFETKHLSPQKRSLRNKFAPIRGIGKWRLKKRSPEVYGKAMDLLDQSDDLIRELVTNQKIHIKELQKFTKRLALIDFANYANKFLKEQKAINAIVENMNKKYSEIAGDLGNINNAINESIGQTGKYPQSEFEHEDHNSYIKEQLNKLTADAKNGMILKEAIIGGRYWKHVTDSGKEFSKKFKLIFNRFNSVLEKNILLLKQLDDNRSKGDPGKYQQLCNGLNGFIVAENIVGKATPEVQQAWKSFDLSQFKPQEKPIEVETQIPMATTMPIEEEKAVNTFDIPELVQMPQPQQNVAIEPPTNSRIEFNESTPVVEKLQTIIGKMEDDANNYESIENKFVDFFNTYSNSNNKILSYPYNSTDETEINDWYDSMLDDNDMNPAQILPQPSMTLSHEEFLFELTKKANVYSQEQIALEMLKYAEQIDGIDTEYALKLMAIAEGVLNG